MVQLMLRLKISQCQVEVVKQRVKGYSAAKGQGKIK